MTANDIKKLRAQHEIVEKQLLQLILENQAACDDELEKYTYQQNICIHGYNIILIFFRIRTLQNDLKSSLENCEHAKNRLKLAKRHITTAGLGLLGNCRKKSLILDLLNSLNNIKMLVRFNTSLYYHCVVFIFK